MVTEEPDASDLEKGEPQSRDEKGRGEREEQRRKVAGDFASASLRFA